MSALSASSAAAPVGARAKAPPSMKRVAGASLAGTTLEFYDHFIYGSAAALVFPKLFFSQASPLTATLLSLASYGVAFVARPFGAALFGAMGDKLGRKWVLVVTLLMMGLSTFAIGLLPSAAAAGVMAPVLLVMLRVLQGLALGGEWGGAALMVNEFDPNGKRRGFYGSLVQIAAPIGLLLANGVFALVTWLVSEEAFMSWGWRIPFLSSALLIAVGLYIRMGLSESPLFEKMEKEGKQGHAPLMEVLRHHKKAVGLALGSRIGSDIAFYVFTLFLLVYLPQQLQMSKSIGLQAVLVGAIAQCIGIPLFGHLSDKIGRRPVIMGGAIAGIAVELRVLRAGEHEERGADHGRRLRRDVHRRRDVRAAGVVHPRDVPDQGALHGLVDRLPARRHLRRRPGPADRRADGRRVREQRAGVDLPRAVAGAGGRVRMGGVGDGAQAAGLTDHLPLPQGGRGSG